MHCIFSIALYSALESVTVLRLLRNCCGIIIIIMLISNKFLLINNYGGDDYSHQNVHLLYNTLYRKAVIRTWCCASESDRANNFNFISIRFVDISSFSACT